MKVYFPKDQINTRDLGPPTLLHCLNILLDFVQIWKKHGTAEGGTERLPISKETSLMGSDTAGNYDKFNFGNNFSVYINADSKEEADRFFSGLARG
jgi:hypothetical protein